MGRGGKCIRLKDRQAIIKSHERGENYVMVANAMGVKRDTAYRIIKKGSNNISNLGGVHSAVFKLTLKLREAIIQMVGDNPSILEKYLIEFMKN